MLLKKAQTGFCLDDQPTSSSYLATDFPDCPIILGKQPSEFSWTARVCRFRFTRVPFPFHACVVSVLRVCRFRFTRAPFPFHAHPVIAGKQGWYRINKKQIGATAFEAIVPILIYKH